MNQYLFKGCGMVQAWEVACSCKLPPNKPLRGIGLVRTPGKGQAQTPCPTRTTSTLNTLTLRFRALGRVAALGMLLIWAVFGCPNIEPTTVRSSSVWR
eukprot:4569903-Amphidinium_carterae.1